MGCRQETDSHSVGPSAGTLVKGLPAELEVDLRQPRGSEAPSNGESRELKGRQEVVLLGSRQHWSRAGSRAGETGREAQSQCPACPPPPSDLPPVASPLQKQPAREQGGSSPGSASWGREQGRAENGFVGRCVEWSNQLRDLLKKVFLKAQHLFLVQSLCEV